MVRVLDLTRLYPGGIATRILLDLGFEVIKVEDTIVGDYLRNISPMLFKMLNAGKKSISLNLKTQEGREIFYRLTSKSDVILESFRPGIMDRLGIGYKALKKLNPRLVYCSINGYGSKGPYSQLPGHDINYISVSGHLDPDLYPREPCVPAVQVADVGSALLCVIGILEHLWRGIGGRIEIPMVEAALLFNTLNIAVKTEGRDPVLTGKYPFYNVYKCRDGYITIGALEGKFWENLCRALGREDLINKKLDPIAIEELERELSKYTQKEVLEKLWAHDVPAAPTNKIEKLSNDPHLRARGYKPGYFLEPIIIDGIRPSARGPTPRRGEHTWEVLRELGYAKDQIKELKKKGIIYYQLLRK